MMTYATASQMETIRAQRVDETARAMMLTGVSLSHDQAGELGDVGCDWIRGRLDLHVSTDDGGVHFAPERNGGVTS